MMHFIREQHLDLARMGATHSNDDLANIMACLKGDDFVKPMKDSLRALADLEANLKLDADRFGKSVQLRQKSYADVRVATETIRRNTDDVLARYSKAQTAKVVPIGALRSA